MQNHNSTSRSMLADQIVNSLKAKSAKYHLTATKKIKKAPKKPVPRKESKSVENLPMDNTRNPELPWYRDDQGRVRHVTFTLQEVIQEKKGCFSEMVKQITERFRAKNDCKTTFSQCFFDRESETAYLANSLNDENRFTIGKTKSVVETSQLSNFISDSELAQMHVQQGISFLYN